MEGPQPGSATDAVATFQRLHGEYMAGAKGQAPTQPIRDFIADITAEYPDITELPDERIDDGVWSDGPLINNASGPLFFFGVEGRHVEDVRPFVARVAAERGLVCFDPQEGACVVLD